MKIFKINYKLAFLTAYMVAFCNGVLLAMKWNTLNEFEVFLCSGLITTAIVGIFNEFFIKPNRKNQKS